MANTGITNIYKMLDNNRKNDNELYLFKIGKFFCCLGKDAYKISDLIGLKINIFSKELNKAGFPEEALEKYNKMIEEKSYYFTIVIANEGKTYTYVQYIKNMKQNKKLENNVKNIEKSKDSKNLFNLVKSIDDIDLESLKLKDVYSIFKKLKKEANEILKKP